MPRRLALEPLTPQAFAPFGAVLADHGASPGRPANFGTALRRDGVVELTSLRPEAKLNVATFACAPRSLPLEVSLVEKHPGSTQLFVPMHAGRFVVVVAPGEDAPRMSEARAFLAEGPVGVAYAPGTWHYPMLVLEAPLLFACFVWEDGSQGDCVEHALAPADRVTVAL